MTTTQVNDTIISLLEAKGWHPTVGRAFCMGLENSGRFTEIREIVCALKKTKVFSARTLNDIEHPERLFSTTRRVLDRVGKAKFYPPYKMNRHETLLFAARYPEVEVIHKSAKLDNAHAFHANCRHVSTEILLGYVRSHASIHGGNPDNVIDVGGNETYHASRNRVVHCDTPVLSARDKARYMHRDVYGGSSSSSRCPSMFHACTQAGDFAIAVHSTYGITLEQLALGMHRRGVKAFFGTIVVPSNLEQLANGDYSSDGTNINVKGNNVSFTFPADSSVAYTHPKSVLVPYLSSRRTINAFGRTFLYRILSLRGDSIFFKLVPSESDERVFGPPLSVVPVLSKYYISIPYLTSVPLEVDAQPFDRIVLRAASARNFASFDIVSLFQYAKSLRLSLTVNSITLSHGFGAQPQDVITMVIAAYCIAASFKIESSDFFRKVTAQVNAARDQGFFMNLLNVTVSSARLLVGAVFAASGLYKLYGLSVDALDKAIQKLPYLQVVVSPFPGSQNFVIDTTKQASTLLVEGTAINRSVDPVPTLKPLPLATIVPITPDTRYLTVPVVGGGARVLVTSGVSNDESDQPAAFRIPPTPQQVLVPLELPCVRAFNFAGTLDAYSVVCNHDTSNYLRSTKDGSQIIEPKVTKQNDFHFTTPSGKRSVIIRGLGKFLMVVGKIKGYKVSGSVTYAVRYDYDITAALSVLSSADPEAYHTLPFTPEYMIAAEKLGLSRFFARSAAAQDGSTTAVPSSDAGPSFNKKPRHPTAESVSDFSDTASDLRDWADDDFVMPEPSSSVPSRGPSTVRGSSVVSRGRGGVRPTASYSPARPASVRTQIDLPLPSLPASPLTATKTSFDSTDAHIYKTDSPLTPTVATTGMPMIPAPVSPTRSGESSSRASVSEYSFPEVQNLKTGDNSVSEFGFMNEVFRNGIVATCTNWLDLAQLVNDSSANARSTWYAVSMATPSQPSVLEHRERALYDLMQRDFVTPGGVFWKGDVMPTSKFLNESVEGDIAMSCEELEVFVVDGLQRAYEKYKSGYHDCEVVLRDAVAANGKTHFIRTNVTENDYVVCETRPALQELRDDIVERLPSMVERCFTADSAIINDRVVEGVDVLYIDEALRLHAGKIYILMRMLKPNRVVCFGDSHQIPSINFLEGYDFLYSHFPYTSTQLLSDSWTVLPCFAYALSGPLFYDRKVVTRNKDVHFIPELQPLDHSSLAFEASAHPDTVVLTYSRSAKKNFRNAGIRNCFTIGEVQGKRYDHVILVRDLTIKMVLYYDVHQSLVAVTRARKSVKYFSPTLNDDSVVAKMIAHARSGYSEYSNHVIHKNN